MANSNIPVKIEFGGIDNITPILGSINLKLNGLGEQVKKVEQISKKLTFATALIGIESFSQKISTISSAVHVSVTSAIDAYSNLEDNMNRLSTLLHRPVSDTFFASLRNQFKDLSEISKKTQSEISDVANEVVKSGVRDETMIKTMVTQSVLLADASKDEIHSPLDAFKMINEFQNSFQIAASKIPEVVDKIAFGRDQGPATFSDIHESFKYAAPVLGAITTMTGTKGVSEFLALEAELANHGITGSTAGTSIRKMVSQFLPSLDKKSLLRLESSDDPALKETLQDFKSNRQNTVLSSLGLDWKRITDKNNKIDVLKALKQVQEKLPTVSNDLQGSVIKSLFGSEALSSGITAIKFLDEIVERMNKIESSSTGKAQSLADSTRNTLKAQIKETENAWENLKISILDSSTGETLKSMTGLFKSMSQTIENTPPPFKSILGTAGIATVGIVGITDKLASMSIVLMALKSLGVFTMLTGEIKTFMTFIGLARTGTIAFSTVAMANPFVWVPLAIAGISLLLLNLDSISEKLKSLDGYQKKVLETKDENLSFAASWDKTFISMKNKKNIFHMPDFLHNTLTLPSQIIGAAGSGFVEMMQGIDKKNIETGNQFSGANLNSEHLSSIGNGMINQYMNTSNHPSAKLDITVKTANGESVKVTQKTKNMPPLQLNTGIAGASH